jgi:hypothetical protein
MKKVLCIVLTVVFVACIAIPSFAKKAEKYDRIVAQIVSLDTSAKTIVVKEEKSGATRTIKISAKAASQLEVGNRVRIKLKPGTDESAGVRVLKSHEKVEPQVESSKVEPSAPATVPALPEKK